MLKSDQFRIDLKKKLLAKGLEMFIIDCKNNI